MLRQKSHISFLLILVFALFTVSGVFAQQNIAIEIDGSANTTSLENQLQYLNDRNISTVILKGDFENSVQQSLISSGLSFILTLDRKYLTEPEFEVQKENISQDISNFTSAFDTTNAFRGIVVAEHSLTDKSFFQNSNQVYFRQADSLVNSRNNVTGYYCDVGSGDEPSSLAKLKNCLATERSLHILDFEAFQSLIENNAEIDRLLKENSLNFSSIALPKASSDVPLIHWSILVLIALWISLVVNIKLNPGYYELIPRYFTAHRFFVDDILSYRERSAASALFLLFQHALFGGLIIYILSKVYISDIGLDALYHHLPYLGILGQNNFSLFVLSSVLIFIVELIALIWIYLPNANLSHFNQVLNLFTWIFHLDFVIGTIIVVLYFAGFGPVAISILAVIYVLIWFSSFNITALNASKKLGLKRNSYLLKTIGLHTIVSFGLVILLIYFNGWWNVLELVVSV